MNDDAFIHRIALTLIEGVGDVLARQLISYCGSVEAVFKEKKKALVRIPEIGPKTADSIIKFKDFGKAESELKFIKKHRIKTCFYLDENYPFRLKNCHDAPLMLYYKGSSDLNKSRIVAIVGTRNATDYGKNFTEELCFDLSRSDVTIVSGLAFGIDITAHKSCLKNKIETIGVVAHGLDRIYPAEHASTARKMIEHGGILTEHVSGTVPDRENFPKRNRIIAGLSDAVVVIEATGTGGALITAGLANSYNRDVFALPGRVGDISSMGCNTLIKTNRAALIQSAADIRYIMGWEDTKKAAKIVQRQLFEDLSEDEIEMMNLFKVHGEVSADKISFLLNKAPGASARTLLSLELKGYIRTLPGKIYQPA